MEDRNLPMAVFAPRKKEMCIWGRVDCAFTAADVLNSAARELLAVARLAETMLDGDCNHIPCVCPDPLGHLKMVRDAIAKAEGRRV